MITTNDERNSQIQPLDGFDPFYLLCDGIPLPIAISHRIDDALDWRDQWEEVTSSTLKAFTCYHPALRNWVSGWTNTKTQVREAICFWENTEKEEKYERMSNNLF